MATRRTLYTGSLTVPDLYAIYGATKKSSTSYSIRLYKHSNLQITEIDLVDAYYGASGYEHEVYAKLTHSASSRSSTSTTYKTRLPNRGIYRSLNINSEPEVVSSAGTPYNAQITAGTFNTAVFRIPLQMTPSTYTINSIVIGFGSTATTRLTYSAVYSYSGDPIVIDLPAKTKSKLTLSNSTPSGASVSWPSGWSSTNYLTIGESYTPGDLTDTNGKYVFTGWYTDSARTTHASFPFTATETDVTLYSGWEEASKSGKIKIGGSWIDGKIKMRVGDAMQVCDRGYVKVDGLWLPIK